MGYSPLNYTLASGVVSALETRLVSGAAMKRLAESSDEKEFYRLLSGTPYHNASEGEFGEKFERTLLKFIENLIVKYIPDEPLRDLFAALRHLDGFRADIKSRLSPRHRNSSSEMEMGSIRDFEKKFFMLPEPFGRISSKIFSLKKPPTPREADFVITSDFFKWALKKSAYHPVALDYTRLLIDAANVLLAFERVNYPSEGGEFFWGGFIDKGLFEKEIMSRAVGNSSAKEEMTPSEKKGDLALALIKLMKLYGRGYFVPGYLTSSPLSFFYEESSAAIGKALDDIKIEFWRACRLKEPFGFHIVTGYIEAVLTSEIKNLRVILSGIGGGESSDKIKRRLRRPYSLAE